LQLGTVLTPLLGGQLRPLTLTALQGQLIPLPIGKASKKNGRNPCSRKTKEEIIRVIGQTGLEPLQ